MDKFKSELYPDFIVELKDYLYAVRNYSDLYIENLLVTVSQFLGYVNDNIIGHKYNAIKDFKLEDVRNLTDAEIYSFATFLILEKKYSQNTRMTKIGHLRTFFDFLFRIKDTLFKQPIKEVSSERNQGLHIPNFLSLDEAKKLINVYKDSENPLEIRDNAIINIFLNCGLRISELANMKISEINLNENCFKVYGKGKKERLCILNKQCKDALIKYLDIRKNLKPLRKEDEDYLFLSFYRTHITPRSIRRNIKKAYAKAKVDATHYSVHTLRHTCATLLHASGVDIRLIKEILGHVKIFTTEIYTHIFDANVMKEMLEHPLAKFKMKDARAYCM